MGLKILFLINGLGTGGAERSLAEALPYFIKNGIDPLIVCFYHRKEGVEQAILAQKFDVRFLTNLSLVERVRQIRQIVLTEKPHLLHSTIFEANLAGRLAALRLPICVINSLVSTPYASIRLQDPNFGALKLNAVRLLDSWTARLCTDHFHAITHAVKLHAMETMHIAAERITVIERGRDPGRLGCPSEERHFQARKKLGFSMEEPILINVGRQEYQKGQKYLLQAVAALITTRPNLTLLIVGRDGGASAELQKLAVALGISQRVHFFGHREDIPDLLAAANLFVFPSILEGLGGALLEAMALGLPIVASDLPALREVVDVGGNALLAAPASATALASAIETLLNDCAKMCSFGQRSRTIFEERFTLEQSASRMTALYHKVIQ